MSKYIDCEKAIEVLRDVYEREFPTGSGAFDLYAVRIVPRVLRNMESIDIVQCKDCANTYWSDGEYYCTAYTLAERTAPDGFCCVGVQK